MTNVDSAAAFSSLRNTKDPSVGVIGLGNWGTALANHLASRGRRVLGWTVEQRVVESINNRSRNEHFLSHIVLHPMFRATSQIAESLRAEVVVLALPSAVIDEVFPTIAKTLRTLDASPLLVSAIKGIGAIKGIEGGSLLTPLQSLLHFKVPHCGAAVLSGPSFAKDVIRGSPCGLVAASVNEDVARYVTDLFSNEAMKVYISTDPLGVELGGIVKNVIALAVGVCDGLGLGDSARAGLITRGLAEMMRLAQAMGANVQTLSGLSGLGDLVMTATCDASRNRTVGLELGRGKKLPEILRALGSVAEGVETTPHVLELARRYNIEMPITQQVSRLLAGEVNPAELVKLLMTRPLRREF